MKVGDLVKLKVGGKDLVISDLNGVVATVNYWDSDGEISCYDINMGCIELSNRRIPDALMLEALQALENFTNMKGVPEELVMQAGKKLAQDVLDKYMKYAKIKK